MRKHLGHAQSTQSHEDVALKAACAGASAPAAVSRSGVAGHQGVEFLLKDC